MKFILKCPCGQKRTVESDLKISIVHFPTCKKCGKNFKLQKKNN